jgi:hypothetical protein
MLIIDIATKKVISRYVFPEEVAAKNNSFLNDLVLDEENEIAYMADVITGGIAVYDYRNNRSRLYVDKTSTQQEEDNNFIINGIDYKKQIHGNSDGLAIDSKNENVFYCPLNGRNLHSIPTKYLRDFTMPNSEIEKYVNFHGAKLSPSDGLQVVDDMLYFGGLTTNSFYAWNYSSSQTLTNDNQISIAQDASTLNWVDTFAVQSFPSDGTYLYLLSNRLNLYFKFDGPSIDFSGASGRNVHIYRYKIQSAQHNANNGGANGNKALTISLSVIGALAGIALLGWIFKRSKAKKNGIIDEEVTMDNEKYIQR